MENLVGSSIENGVGRIIIDRPARRNAMDKDMRSAFAATLESFDADPAVRAILISGAGGHFCSGADVGQFGAETIASSRRRMKQGGLRIATLLASTDKPTIAAVDGVAYGLGWAIALGCDIVLAGRGARFSMPFAKLGLVADSGSAYHLTRLLGPLRAKELLFTARTLTVEEALSMGLVSRLFDSEILEEEALAMAVDLASGPTLAFAMMKHLVDRSISPRIDAFLRDEALISPQMRFTADFAEGTSAFRENRPARFTGE
ncbi:enoyl-CoA hydratase/isomerase family protein [Oryzicola mucosus]|uniref:Enoyl-CoA hydratase/isomerase family protein n=1 Tax=Oryzicola mucosus TaxID=2767425 RepID=A0A8J6PR27_9HYPH|nr:enoyl-CoA hydratase-related protein [Oryzicola mucosus]MBD0417367.1 enoyl-CoA hydratase/isomerase family protein [Oryzicola mucosus]